MSHTADAARLAQRLPESAAQHNGGVLYEMMPADIGIALRLQRDVKQAVAGNLAYHMVQKAVAGVNFVMPDAV